VREKREKSEARGSGAPGKSIKKEFSPRTIRGGARCRGLPSPGRGPPAQAQRARATATATHARVHRARPRRRPCLPACLISSYRQPHGWAYGPRPRWWAREMRRAALGARARNGITQRARDREGGHFPLGPAAGGLCRRRCGRACLPALPLPVEKGRGATSCLVCVLPGRLRGSGACRLGCSGVERPGFSGFFFCLFLRGLASCGLHKKSGVRRGKKGGYVTAIV